MGNSTLLGYPILLALTSRPESLRSASTALFYHRWEYPPVPAIGGSENAVRFFACHRQRDDVALALANTAEVQGDARSRRLRTKQQFGTIPLDDRRNPATKYHAGCLDFGTESTVGQHQGPH